jgi:hypothetical protein
VSLTQSVNAVNCCSSLCANVFDTDGEWQRPGVLLVTRVHVILHLASSIVFPRHNADWSNNEPFLARHRHRRYQLTRAFRKFSIRFFFLLVICDNYLLCHANIHSSCRTTGRHLLLWTGNIAFSSIE